MWCAITGIGMVTPLGRSASETWKALLRGMHITRHCKPEGFEGPLRLAHMATAAARQAVVDAGWESRLLADDSTGLVTGTSKGLIELWMSADPSLPAGLAPSPLTFGHIIAAELGMGPGPHVTVCGACASGLLAMVRAAMMLRAGEARRVLVVAAEASVHPLFLGSFQRLGVLAMPSDWCRPYDARGGGFLMSEAAAAVCLEPQVPAGRTGAVIVEHCGFAGDSFHMTRPDADMKVLRKLLGAMGRPGDVQFVHGHGTGTPGNDPAELAAIAAVLGSRTSPPVVWSHKGALGHSLGAAGLLAVALSCLCHREAIVPPMPTCWTPLNTTGVRVEPRGAQLKIQCSIVIASGFGGATAAVKLCS